MSILIYQFHRLLLNATADNPSTTASILTTYRFLSETKSVATTPKHLGALPSLNFFRFSLVTAVSEKNCKMSILIGHLIHLSCESVRGHLGNSSGCFIAIWMLNPQSSAACCYHIVTNTLPLDLIRGKLLKINGEELLGFTPIALTYPIGNIRCNI